MHASARICAHGIAYTQRLEFAVQDGDHGTRDGHGIDAEVVSAHPPGRRTPAQQRKRRDTVVQHFVDGAAREAAEEVAFSAEQPGTFDCQRCRTVGQIGRSLPGEMLELRADQALAFGFQFVEEGLLCRIGRLDPQSGEDHGKGLVTAGTALRQALRAEAPTQVARGTISNGEGRRGCCVRRTPGLAEAKTGMVGVAAFDLFLQALHAIVGIESRAAGTRQVPGTQV